MNKFALFAALLVVSTASVGSTYNQVSSNAASTTEVKGLLHNSPLTTGGQFLPKCFPHCDGY